MVSQLHISLWRIFHMCILEYLNGCFVALSRQWGWMTTCDQGGHQRETGVDVGTIAAKVVTKGKQGLTLGPPPPRSSSIPRVTTKAITHILSCPLFRLKPSSLSNSNTYDHIKRLGPMHHL
jgi:hypothetical protein